MTTPFTAAMALEMTQAAEGAKAFADKKAQAERDAAAAQALGPIIEEIKASARRGLYSCSVSDWEWSAARDSVIARLKEMGFRISGGHPSIDPCRYYTIKWGA